MLRAIYLNNLFAGLLVLGSPAASAVVEDVFSACMQGWWCAKQEINGSTAHLSLVNTSAYPVTITVELWPQNATAVDIDVIPQHVTRSLAAWQTQTLFAFQPHSSNRKSRIYPRFHWVAGELNAIHDDNYLYRYPYASGQNFAVVQGFNGDYSHSGASRFAMDFAMPVGTPVHAARAGVVIDLEQSNTRGGASRRFAQYANYIVILHADGTTGEYYHLMYDGVLVERGQHIQRGDKIGLSGNTGFSSLPHLHFAVYTAKAFGRFQSVPFQFTPH